jgi:TetR/AcrR family transcriptional regulator, regulator of mycofactocin system
MIGLRERNRRRTRRDIAHVALRLFDERGFESTTIDEVAEAAGVSRSTFFRYFPVKELVLFPTHDEDLAAYRATLADADTTVPVRQALLQAALDASTVTIDSYRRDPEMYRKRYALIDATPSLQATSLRLDRDWEAALADVFHQQLTRLPGDTRNAARLLAGSLMGTVSAFHRTWAEQGFADDPANHRDQVMRIFEHGLSAATDPHSSGPTAGPPR